MQVVSGIGYMITYEKARDVITQHTQIRDNKIKGLFGGFCGSIVGQTIITPFDVVSQQLMILGNPRGGNIAPNKFSSLANPLYINHKDAQKFGISLAVIRGRVLQKKLTILIMVLI